MKVREPQWLQSGGYIHKMELGDSISNIKQSRQNFWDIYNQDVINNWKRLAGNQSVTMDEMNDFIGQHWNLYNTLGYNDSGKAIKGSDVKAYQEAYHNKYGFGNSDAFWEGFSRLGHDPNKQTADYRRKEGEQFVGDDYYGGQTHRRRATYFNPEELAIANEAVKSRGWEFVEDPNEIYNGEGDGRKVYKLRQITNAPSGTQGDVQEDITKSNSAPTKPQQNLTELTFDNDKGPQKSKLAWSDWAPLTMQLANDLTTNSYINQQKKKMRFPLKEGPFLQHAITNDYYARTKLGQAASEARNIASTQNLTSDINQNLRIRDAAEKQAGQYESQAAQMKSNKFAEESRLSEDVANKNKITGADVANYNSQANAAAWNNILLANQEQAAKNLQAANSYIGNMYQSYGEALKTKRLNDAQYQKAYNQAKANQQIKNARNEYNQNSSDFTKWNDFGAMFEDALNSGDDFKNYLYGKQFQTNWANQQKLGLSQEQRNALTRWLTSGQSTQASKWRESWAAHQQKLKDDYYNKVIGINENLEAENAKSPMFIDNQWRLSDFNLNTDTNRVSPLWRDKFQKGGRIGSKLSDFTKQYQRELQHVRRSQDERNKTTLKHLDRQLERLSKEQLILLRSVFK